MEHKTKNKYTGDEMTTGHLVRPDGTINTKAIAARVVAQGMKDEAERKAQHTAGPWRAEYLDSMNGWIMDENGNYLATIVTSDDEGMVVSEEEQLANARLMASAPDLLSVLKEAVDHKHVYDTNPALVELFEAVIAKATKGQQS